jgi:hypothetical protein
MYTRPVGTGAGPTHRDERGRRFLIAVGDESRRRVAGIGMLQQKRTSLRVVGEQPHLALPALCLQRLRFDGQMPSRNA